MAPVDVRPATGRCQMSEKYSTASSSRAASATASVFDSHSPM